MAKNFFYTQTQTTAPAGAPRASLQPGAARFFNVAFSLLVLLVSLWAPAPCRALNVVFAWTNSSTGQLDTNNFRIIPKGSVRNSDGTFNFSGLPVNVRTTGRVTNWLTAQFYQITNSIIGDGFYIRVYDNSSNVVTAGDSSIYCGNANPFINLVIPTNQVPAGTLTNFQSNVTLNNITNQGDYAVYSAANPLAGLVKVLDNAGNFYGALTAAPLAQVTNVVTNAISGYVPNTIGSGTSTFIGGTNINGAELVLTNNNAAGWAGFTAQADNGSFGTNYIGMYVNNSRFVPGAGIVGSTNDASIEAVTTGNVLFDIVGNNSKLIFTSRATTAAAGVTNAVNSGTNWNFTVPVTINGNPVLTNAASSGGLTNGAVTTNLTIYVPVLKVWPDVVWGLGDSKSCEFRTNANTWSVHGGYSNPLAISLYPPYTTNNGIFTYTNGTPSTVVTNGGSWMVYFTNRTSQMLGRSVTLNNSLAQSGLSMASYVGAPYLTAKGTGWIPPYVSPNGGDPLLYLSTNTLYTGRPWVLIHGGQNDLVLTNGAGLWQTMTNLYGQIRAQGKIAIGSTITITPAMFQVPATPNWSQLTAIGTNVLIFNSLLLSNQTVCDAVVDVQTVLSNRVTSGTGWITGMTTNWWDGTHPIDQEADWEASVWVSSIDTNAVFWGNVASYQSPSYQLSRWSKLNPDTYRTTTAITNNNSTPFTNTGVVTVGDALTIYSQSVSPRLNVGNVNDSYIRVGGSLTDGTSAIFGMIGNTGWWMANSTTGDTFIAAKPGNSVIIGDGGGANGVNTAGIKVNVSSVLLQTNVFVKAGVFATNGVASYRTNAWLNTEISTNGFADWYSNSAAMYRSVNKLGVITNVLMFTTP